MTPRSKIGKRRDVLRTSTVHLPFDKQRLEKWTNALALCRVVEPQTSNMERNASRIRMLAASLFTSESSLIDKQSIAKELQTLFQTTPTWADILKSVIVDMYPNTSQDIRDAILEQNLSFLN